MDIEMLKDSPEKLQEFVNDFNYKYKLISIKINEIIENNFIDVHLTSCYMTLLKRLKQKYDFLDNKLDKKKRGIKLNYIEKIQLLKNVSDLIKITNQMNDNKFSELIEELG